MLPLRDDVASRSIPKGVSALIAVQVLVFLGLASQGAEVGEWLERWGLVPRLFLRSLGGPPERAWLTPITSMFLHAGLVHLAGNALFLWVFGRRIEDLLGSLRFALFYAVCGLCAALVHVAASPSSYIPAVGASGAISGLLGAYAIAYPTGRLRLLWPPVRVPAFLFLGVWIAIQLAAGLGTASGAGEGVAWWAHVGGFACGAALGRSMRVRDPRRSRLRI